ncbi:MAG: hypothetical protein HF967_10885 [Methanosarcinales archaeon]|jgi:hypothetical protein|nr:hypothetical protein [Methanosarcinales archaeon]
MIKTIIIILITFGGFILSDLYSQIIGSTIIISMGLILLLFPKIPFNVSNSLSISKNAISSTRLAAICIILSGITILINIPHHMTISYVLGSFGLIILIDGYDDKGKSLEQKELEQYGYDEDKNKIKDAQYGSSITFGSNNKDNIKNGISIKSSKNSVRNNVEWFIYILLWICVAGCILSIIMDDFLLTLLFICISGVLIVFCPNAIDSKRTKYSQLCARIGSTMIGIGSGSFILIKYEIIDSFLLSAIIIIVNILLLMPIGIALIYIVSCDLDPKKYWILRKVLQIKE